VRRVLLGGHGCQLDRNLAALARITDRLTPHNAQRLEVYQRARAAGVLRHWQGLRRAGVYRQSRLGHVAMYLAAMFKRG
jgi:hypothetical protein